MRNFYKIILTAFVLFCCINSWAQVYIADSTRIYKKKTPASYGTSVSFAESNVNNTVAAGQDPTSLFPPTPTAAALTRYGDIPVSYHTGTPNISVPIYEVKSRGLSLPISLSYHGSGVKVGDVASWVGLGWSLNAGGVITRTVQSIPDEGSSSSANGYYARRGTIYRFARGCEPYRDYRLPLSATYNHPGVYCPTGDSEHPCGTPSAQQQGYINQRVQDYIDAENGLIDTEPDLFFFNIGGYSGKFVFDSLGTPHLFPEQDLTIEIDYVSNQFRQFKLITPDGTQYFFGNTHGEGSSFTPAIPEGSPAYEESANAASNYVRSSWYLTKIVSADGKSKILFTYTQESYSYFDIKHQYISDPYFASSPSGPPQYDVDKMRFNGVRLSSIYTSDNNTRVDFIADSTPRQDIAGRDGSDNLDPIAFSLKEIRIFSGVATVFSLFKKFVFSYDYFIAGTGPSNFPEYGGGEAGYTRDKKRLRLLSVGEVSGDGSIVMNPYTFEYNPKYNNLPINIPRRISFGRDHWGYYNGKEGSNLSLIHVKPYDSSNPTGPGLDDGVSVGVPRLSGSARFKTSDRIPSAAHIAFASLTKITYPTKGYTEFTFENHTNGIPFLSYATVGGLRIKSIKNYNSDGTLLTQKDFDYMSTGKVYSKPNYYIQAKLWTTTVYGKLKFCDPTLIPMPMPGSDVKDIASSSPVLELTTTQGSHIGYTKVKVSEPGNGSTIYNYNTADFNGYPVGGYGEPGKFDFFGVERLFNYPRDPLRDNYKRGQLEKEEVFKEGTSTNPVSETTYAYTIDEKTTNILALKIDANTLPGYPAVKMYNRYAFFTGRSDLTSKTVKTCDVDGLNCVTTASTFAYGSTKHFQMTASTSETSSGDILTTKYQYVKDYTFSGTSATDLGVKTLVALKAKDINVPIETYVTRKASNGTNERTVSGDITYFDETALKPSYKYTLELLAPATTFTTSTVTATPTFTKDSKYTTSAAQYSTFYASGNVKETYVREGTGQVTTYLWGYNHALPVAEIKNATYAKVALALGQTVIDDIASRNNYSDDELRTMLAPILSIESSTTNPSLVTLATIYTYKPLYGITSNTAPNGIKTSYEYDKLGRLLLIKDGNGQVVKSYRYNYE